MEDPAEHLRGEVQSALVKLKASMDDGPGGENATLTPSESCLVYRLLTENLGLCASA